LNNPENARFLIGTVADVTSGGVKVVFDGTEDATEKRYKQLSTAITLTAGDRVVIMKISGSYVVLGRIDEEQPEIETGDIYLSSKTQTVGIIPSANVSTPHLYLRDKLKTVFGRLEGLFYTTGPVGARFAVERNIDGVLWSNYMSLLLNGSGDPSVLLSAPTAWRLALGIGTSGSLPVTIAQGGSGQTGTGYINRTSDILAASDLVTVSEAHYAYWGKIAAIVVKGNFTTTASAGTERTLFTLVEGKRPRFLTPARVFMENAALYNTGNFVYTRAITANQGFTALALYLLW